MNRIMILVNAPKRAFLLFSIIATLFTGAVGADPAVTKRLRDLDFTPFQSPLSEFRTKDLAQVEKAVANKSIPQLQAQMRAGKLTSEQLTLYYLARIQNYDEYLRSYVEINPKALEEAREADRQRASGHVLGPMHGIPVNLKDNIETTQPMHTTGGAEILLNHVPAKDAPVVTKLRHQGAVVLGKASLSELAGAVTITPPGSNAVAGAGRNPYRSDLPVMGSSSGSGISTSASLTAVSVGTETSGSLIAPASFNGVVGMKPSRGLVSGQGVIPLIHFQDSPGPVARSVTDAAILLGVIDSAEVDYTRKLDPKALAKVRVGILPELVKPEYKKPGGVLERIEKGLRHCGAVQVPLKTPMTQPNLTYSLILGFSVDTVGYLEHAGTPAKSLTDLHTYNAAEPARRIPFTQGFVDVAVQAVPEILKEYKTPPDQAGALYQRLALANRKQAETALAGAFAQSQVRVLVSTSNLHSQLYATAGYPAITVPLGLAADGSPMSLTFIARPGDDAQLLAYAFAFEQATRLRVIPTRLNGH